MSHKLSPTKFSQIAVKEDFNDDCSEDCNKDCMAISCVGLGTVSLGICILLYFVFSAASKPDKPMEFIIADALITKFNLTSDNTLYYNFKLNISVANPEYHGSTHRSRITITAISSYKGNKFAVVNMESFVPDSKKTILLKPVLFYGNNLIKLDAQQRNEYDDETRLRIFNLDLKLDWKSDNEVYCLGLRVPLISNGKLESFNVTKCSREYQGWGQDLG